MIASFFGLVFFAFALMHAFKSDILLRKAYRDHPNRKRFQKFQALGNCLLALGFVIVGQLFPGSDGSTKLYLCMVISAIPGIFVFWKGRKLISKAAREEAERYVYTPVDPVVSARNAKKRNKKK